MFVTSWFKCRLVGEWKVSWYRAAIGFYVARGHFCRREQYNEQTKQGAQGCDSHGDVRQTGREPLKQQKKQLKKKKLNPPDYSNEHWFLFLKF